MNPPPAASRPVLFMSHATRTLGKNDPAVRFRDALFAALAEKWNPFLDRNRLQPGDRWRDEILLNLAGCAAGVVLFAGPADQSDWVKAEATVLCFRHALDRRFKVVPVVFDKAVFDNTFRASLNPFQLGEIQRVEYNPAEPVEALATRVAGQFDPADAGAVGQCRWVDDLVRRWLAPLDRQDPAAVRRLLAAHQIDAAAAAQNPGVALGQYLFQCELDHVLRTCREVIPALAAREERDRFARHVRHRLVPHEWVEALAYAATRPGARGLLGVSPGDENLVRDAVDRFRYDLHEDRIVRLVTVDAAFGESDEDAVRHVERAFQMQLGKYTPAGRPFVLRQAIPDQMLVVCALEQSLARPEALRELRQRYSDRVLFLVWPAQAALAEAYTQIGLTLLAPPLDGAAQDARARFRLGLDTYVEQY